MMSIYRRVGRPHAQQARRAARASWGATDSRAGASRAPPRWVTWWRARRPALLGLSCYDAEDLWVNPPARVDMEWLASILSWLFFQTVYGSIAVGALVYLALRELRKRFPRI